jgi:hypothetical protein
MSNITAVSIAVQIDGKAYFVNLPHERMLILMQMASALFDGGRLGVVPAPPGFEFTALSRHFCAGIGANNEPSNENNTK